MRVFEIKESEKKDAVRPVKYELPTNAKDVQNLVSAIMKKKNKEYYNERIKDIIKGCESLREKYGNSIDLYSFIIGVVWCEDHPSKETVFRAIDTFCCHDREQFTNGDVNMVLDTITNRKW